MRMHGRHVAFVIYSVLLLQSRWSRPVSARLAPSEIKPGTKITPANVALVKDLVSPGVYWRAKNGMVMNIIPTGRIDWPPPYKEATEKYSAQVRLAPNRLSLQGYVAGSAVSR